MAQMTRGQKMKLADTGAGPQLRVGLGAVGAGLSFDISCFGVDAGDKLSDDRYFVFFNQTSSPEGAIKLAGARGEDSQSFEIDLSRLPGTIRKLVFAITIDGSGKMRQLQSGHFRLVAGGAEAARFNFSGSDFAQEKAIIAGEIYLKDVWRVAAVGQGFSGGLSALLKYFGGQEIEEAAPAQAKLASTSGARPATPAATPTPTPRPTPPTPLPTAALPRQAPPTPIPTPPQPARPPTAPPRPVAPPVAAPRVSLDKDRALQVKLEKEAPHLVSLSKTLAVSLAKKGLSDVVARVALVLDASGSMNAQYTGGKVQAVVDRIATLAMRFDDDGELDTWGYASRHRQLEAVTIHNVQNYVREATRGGTMFSIMRGLGVSNNEPPVMREVLEFYRASATPAFVVFISDGGVGSGEEIKRVLTEASRFPIFWQFVGLGGSNYGILQQLDTMRGRTVDNANFFHVDDLAHIGDETLYNRLLGEFPAWLHEASSAGILR